MSVSGCGSLKIGDEEDVEAMASAEHSMGDTCSCPAVECERAAVAAEEAADRAARPAAEEHDLEADLPVAKDSKNSQGRPAEIPVAARVTLTTLWARVMFLSFYVSSNAFWAQDSAKLNGKVILLGPPNC